VHRNDQCSAEPGRLARGTFGIAQRRWPQSDLLALCDAVEFRWIQAARSEIRSAGVPPTGTASAQMFNARSCFASASGSTAFGAAVSGRRDASCVTLFFSSGSPSHRCDHSIASGMLDPCTARTRSRASPLSPLAESDQMPAFGPVRCTPKESPRSPQTLPQRHSWPLRTPPGSKSAASAGITLGEQLGYFRGCHCPLSQNRSAIGSFAIGSAPPLDCGRLSLRRFGCLASRARRGALADASD
jgi:hypothetical protein